MENGMIRTAIALGFLLIACTVAAAGVITPGLLDAYNSRSASEAVPVLILLSDRVSAPDLAEACQRQGLALPEIHAQIMDSLQASASLQSAVMRSIEILQSTGMASDVRPFWITNMIAARLTKPGAELVANMNEVAEVGLDETITIRNAELSRTSESPPRESQAMLRTGIRDVWERGFHGEGRTVCILSDGVDAGVPALTRSWRGRAQDVSQSWFDPSATETFASCKGQGTALAGIICGADPQSGDTVGSAPAANWIAARLFCEATRLSDVIAAWQWAADPDGNSATVSDVPDAICNAWGLNAACNGAEPQGLWDVVENVEWLGPVLVFAANDGASRSNSIRSPESHPDCFAVGNADVSGASTQVRASSGRGPSPCDVEVTKPDVVAPGTSVFTAGPSGYARATGTASAAANAAAAVALVRQANPLLPASEVKRLLTVTATDLGSSGPDNVFGHGLLDVARAVNLALSSGSSGKVHGVVRYGGVPIPGARVLLSGAFGDLATTAVNGTFRFDHVVADRAFQLSGGRFGFKYLVYLDSISVLKGQTVSFYLDLERGFEDDAEHDQGWSLGVEGDNATSGIWVRAVPVPSRAGGRLVQPDSDTSPGGRCCFVTGNAASPSAEASDADVDGGRTTLRSPIFDLTELSEPVLSFSYWYSNDLGSNPGGDFFRVQVSSDGGETWASIINTAASTDGWTSASVPLQNFVAPSTRMVLQFVAEDAGPGSLVEAAVDDIAIHGAATVPEPPRGLVIDVQFDQVLLTWRPSSDASAYRVYLSGDPEHVVLPENLYTTVRDTVLAVPMSDIHFDQFFFQVTAER